MRLTKQMRRKIAYRVIAAATKGEVEQLTKLRERIALAVFEAMVPLMEQKQIANSPRHWFHEVGRVRVTLPSAVHGTSASYTRSFDYMLPTNRLAPCDYWGKVMPFQDIPADVQEDIILERKLLKELDGVKVSLDDDTMSILNSVTTRKRLLEDWPEITQHVDAVIPDSVDGSAAPAPINELNARMGLDK